MIVVDVILSLRKKDIQKTTKNLSIFIRKFMRMENFSVLISPLHFVRDQELGFLALPGPKKYKYLFILFTSIFYFASCT